MLWVTLAAIGGLIIGFILGTKAQAGVARDNWRIAARYQAGDRAFLLSVLRRELANWLLRRDPDRFHKTYTRAHHEAQQLLEKDASVQQTQFKVLCDKYPMYVEFDYIGTREHVLYADALSGSDIDDIEQHYRDLLSYQTLLQALDVNWRHKGATTADNLAHLEEYVRRVKDTRFKQRLERAAEIFFAYQQGEYFAGKAREAGSPLYNSSVFSVYHAYDLAGIRHGFHFKDTNEYGVESSFRDDDRDRTYRHYGRSDMTFTEDASLDTFSFDELV